MIMSYIENSGIDMSYIPLILDVVAAFVVD